MHQHSARRPRPRRVRYDIAIEDLQESLDIILLWIKHLTGAGHSPHRPTERLILQFLRAVREERKDAVRECLDPHTLNPLEREVLLEAFECGVDVS